MMRLVPVSLLLLSGLVSGQATSGLVSPPAVQPNGAVQPVKPAIPPDTATPPNSLLDLPPLSSDSRVSLLGGTIANVSHVENRLQVRAFGGKQHKVAFDVRTRLYLDGKPAKSRDLKPGERVYVDTMLDGGHVFAKTIWIRTQAVSGEGRGQILSYDASRGLLQVRDELTSQPVTLHVRPSTVVSIGDKTGTTADLRTGSIISLVFGPEGSRGGDVRQVSILAQPGSQFTFVGAITYVDMSRNMIAINNRSDDRSYELYLENLPSGSFRNLRQGSVASIQAVFDGQHYVARSLQMMPDQAETK
jgi:hypothetical protein